MIQTPFKSVFTKTSNFTRQSFDTDPITIDFGGSGKFLIPRHGDFITRIYALIDYTSVASLNVNQGHAMLDFASIVIGGTTFQQETGETLNMRLNLTQPENETFTVAQLFRMLGGSPTFPFSDTSQYPRPYQLQIPLDFWFHNTPELALPLCALRYQEVEVEIGLRNSDRWGGVDAGINSSEVRLRIEYGYAPKDVVDSLINRPLIFPVEQFQVEEVAYTNNTSFCLKPEFVNPVKALFVVFKDKSLETVNAFDYSRGQIPDGVPTPTLDARPIITPDIYDFIDSMEIILDNEVLMPKEIGTYKMYRGIQYYSHFPGACQTLLNLSNRYYGFVYALSLCKDPMNRTSPNGSINFSTINNPLFNIIVKKSTKNYYIGGPFLGSAYTDGDVTTVEWGSLEPTAKIGDYVEHYNLPEDTKIIAYTGTTNQYIVDKQTINSGGNLVKPYIYKEVLLRLYALSMNLLYIENGVARPVFTGSEISLPRYP